LVGELKKVYISKKIDEFSSKAANKKAALFRQPGLYFIK
jgi:hypothetical protein